MPLFLLLLAVASGCAMAPGAPLPERAVAGTLSYRERIALPPDATVHVRLEDVSLADAPARVLAETTFAAGGRQVPFAFRLPYRPAEIDARHRYAVRGEIRMPDGALAWTTDTHTAVLTQGGTETAELRLVAVVPKGNAGGDTGADPFADARARGVTWRALGTEPFWSLDVTDGGTMRLERVGAETVRTPTPTAVVSRRETRYAAETEAHTLTVSITDEPCSDGMSDRTYSRTVTVVVDGETLSGCGEAL